MNIRELQWRFTRLELTPKKLTGPLSVSNGAEFVRKQVERYVNFDKGSEGRKACGHRLMEYYRALIAEQGERDWDAELLASKREAAPQSIVEPDGKAYVQELDYVRLSKRLQITFECMKDGTWRTLEEISAVTGGPEASESARLRDFRKDNHGGHTVLRRRRGDAKKGLFEYRLILRAKNV
jgi:hypothetical protein